MKRRALFFFLPSKFCRLLLPLIAAWPLASRAATLDWDPTISGGTALGGPGTWDNLTTTNWWDSGLLSQIVWNNANNDTARFGGTPGTGAVNVAAGGITAGGLIFSANGYTLSGGTLTLSGATPGIAVTNAGQSATINNLLASTTGLTKTGAGTLNLGGNNAGFSGASLISAGSVRLNNAGAMGTSNVTVDSAGTLEATTAGGILTNGVILNGGIFRYSGSGQLNLGAGKSINLTANSTIQSDTAGVNGKIFLAAGQLASSAGTVLTKTGPGMIQIAGANTGVLSTSTILNGGLIEFQHVDGLGTGTQTITLNSGTEFVASGVAARHNFTLNTGATISANSTGAGDFTGALTLNGNTTAALRLFQNTGAPGTMRISGSLAGSGNLIITGAPTAVQTSVAGPPTGAAPAAIPGQSGLYLTANTTGYTGSYVLGNLGRLATVPTTAYDPLGANTVTFSGGTLALSADLSGGALANPGFLGRYFNGALIAAQIGGVDLGALPTVATRNDAIIDSPNAAGGGFTPAVAGLNLANIGATWSGALNVTTAGVYNFNSNSDDGSMIYVDGMPVAVNDASQGQLQRGSHITLSAGLHSVVVKWGQGAGGAAMQASYSGPDTANTNVRIGSVASSVTNSGSAIIGTNTIDNPMVISPSLSGTIDLGGVNVTSTGSLTFGAGGTFTATGLTGLETLTHSGTVTLTGMNMINTGTTGALAAFASSRADVVLSGTVGEATAGSSILKTGTGTLTLSGTNNFTGTAFTGHGVLALSGTLAGGVGATSVIGATGGTVRWLASDRVADTGKISLYGIAGLGGGTADLNGFSDTVGGVNIVNNQGAGATTLQTGAGTLTLAGNVLVLGSSTGTNTISGNLNLGGGAAFATYGQNTTNVSAVLSNGSLTKNGLGSLTLSGANSAWTGLVTVNNGKLTVGGVDGLGSAATGTLVNSGGYVDIPNIAVSEPLTINGKGQPYIGNNAVSTYGLLYTGALQGSGGFAAAANGPITIGSAGTGIGAPAGSLLTVNGVIGDGGNNYGLSITQGNNAGLIATGATAAGPGIVKFTAANTFGGPLTIEAGDLWLANSGVANAGAQSLATNNIIIGNGRADAALTTVNNNQFAPGTVLTFANGSKNAKFQLNGTTQTVAGFNSTGSLPIIQNHEVAGPGAGTLIIDNPSNTSFNGLIRDQISTLAVTKTGAGTMTFSGNGVWGTAGAIYTGATIINAGKLIISDETAFNSPITLNTGGATAAALEFNNSFGRSPIYARAITDNGLGFTKTGLGNLTLNVVNAVSGPVNVNAGTLNLTNATGNVNPLPNAPINVAAGAQLEFHGVGAVTTSFNNNVTLNGMSHGGALAGTVITGNSINTHTGTLTLNATSNVSTGGTDRILNLTGQITGPGGLVFDKLLYTQTPGVFNITNATNDYAGGTTINTGTVQFTSGALPSTGNLKFGGTFGNGGNVGTGQLVLSTTAGATFNRALGTGAGQVQFTGDGGGFTAIGTAGTVNFGGAGAEIDWQGTGSTGMDASSSLVMNMGTGANNAITVANPINLNSGVRRIVDNTNNITYSGVIRGSAGLILEGAGQHRFIGTGANTYTGLTNLTGGVLALNRTGGDAIAGDIMIGNNQGGTRRIVYLGAGNQIADTATLSFLGSSGNNGDLRMFGFNETIAAVQDRSGGGVIEIAESGDAGYLGTAISTTATSTLTVGGTNLDSFFNGFFRNNGANNATATGVLNVIKNGTGTFTLSAGQQSLNSGQTYSGTTTINGGQFIYANVGTNNSPVVVNTGAKVGFITNFNQNLTNGQVISGVGDLTKTGAGQINLGGANSYSGTTTVNGGTLAVTGTTTAGHTGGYTVNANGTLVIGNGTTGGVLTANNNITVNSGGTVAFSKNNGSNYSGIISGAGNVESRVGGTATILSGANTFSGSTTVNAGAGLRLAGNGASAGGLTVNSGGTLNLDFTLPGANASGIAAATAPVNVNAGTLTVTGSGVANTQALGPVTIGAGNGTINLTSGAGGLTVNMGAFSHATGGTAVINLPGLGNANSSGTAVGGILSGFTTTSGGNTWVAQDGSGNLTPLAAYGLDTYGAGVNTDVTTSAAGGSTNSIRFNTAAASTVTMAGANTINSGGILVTSTVGNNASTITGGTIAGSSTAGLTVIQSNTANSLTVGSGIVDNGGASGLTKSGGGTLILSGSNTYSGPTVVTQGTLVSSGTSGGGTATIGTNAILQIGNGTTNGIIPALNPNTGGTFVIGNGTAQTAPRYNAGANFNFTANAASNATSFQNATFQKTGSGTLTITNPLLTGSFLPRNGTTVIDTGGNVVSNNFSGPGLANGDNGTLTVKGQGRFTNTNDFNISDQSGSRGTLNIQDSAQVVAATFYVGKTATSVGVVNQSLGAVAGSGGGDWRIGGTDTAQPGAYGAYNLSGGTFTTNRNFQIGASGIGVFNQTGGTVSVTGGFADVGRYSGGNGMLGITNGTFTNSTLSTSLIVGEDGSGVLNVGGTGQLILATTSGAGVTGLRLGHNAPGTGVANLNAGGLILTTGVTKGTGTGTFNFNGGVLRANTGVVSASFMTGLTAANVYSGGANIDTNGLNATIAQPLLAPAGDGVASIALGTGGSGYVSEPIVTITGGGGTGATARAIISGGAITGYTITNPGTGYTSAPTIALLGGGPAVAGTAGAPVTAANATTGILNKLGTGTLTLTGAGSTYGGATVVSGGTLTLNGQTATISSPSLGFGSTISYQGSNVVAGNGIFNYDNTGAIAALSKTFSGNVTFDQGEGTVQTTRTAAFDELLTFNNFSRNGTATGNFAAAGTLSATNGISFTTVPAIATVLSPGLFAGGANYAVYDTGGWVRPLAYGTDANTTTSAAGATLTGPGAGIHTNVTGTITAQTTAQFGTIRDSGAFNITLAAGATLTAEGILKSGASAGIISGGTALTSVGNQLHVRADASGDTLTITTPITGATSLIKSGAGVLILNSATGTNTYSGGETVINNGTLRLGLVNQIPDASNVTVHTGASFDLNNLSETINGLSGMGTVTTSIAGSPTLTVGNSNASTVFGGVIQNGSGTPILTKAGSGTLTLTGINTYTGATNISAGAIALAVPNALSQATTINVNVNNGLQFDTTVPVISGLAGNGSISLQTRGTAPLPNAPVQLSVGSVSSSYNGALTGSGILVKTGAGTLTLTGANTNTGGIMINAGTLILQGNNSGASGLTMANAGTMQLNALNAIYGGSGRTLQVATGAILTPQAFTANPTSTGFGSLTPLLNRLDPGSLGVLALQAEGSLQTPISENLDFSASGQVSLGATLTGTSGLGNAPVQYTGVITPNSNTFRLGGGGGRLIMPNGASMSGANSLFLYGGGNTAGQVFLTGNYGYTGSTFVNAGQTYITSLANGGSASSIGASGSAASNLVLNGGVLTYVGDGSVATSTTDRLFTISAAPTVIESSGSGPVNFTNTGAIGFLNNGNRSVTLQGNNTGANTLAASITDSVVQASNNGALSNGLTTVVKSGNGTWVLSGNNTHSGGTTINNGVLQFNSAASIGGNTVNGPASVLVGVNGTVALGGTLTTGIQSTLQRVSPLSTGTVALTADTGENINFDGGLNGATLPQAYLGAYGNVNYSGSLTPFGSIYRLGGGGGVLTIAGGGLTGARQLFVGGGGPFNSAGAFIPNPTAGFYQNQNLNGNVVLGGTSDYSGGTILQSGGMLSATSLTALGTGPLKFQGGFYRAVDATDITLASDGTSTREIRIGTDANGSAVTANVDVVSGVNAVFSKEFGVRTTLGSNQGQATFTKWGGGSLVLNGINLSNSTGANNVATNSGTLTIERGTLGLAANPTNFNGLIQVGSNHGGVGTLKLAADNVFANTIAQFGTANGASVIDTFSGSAIDLNGKVDTVRVVRGAGSIINTGAPTANLTMGTANEVAIFLGNLVGDFTLTRGGNVTTQFGTGGNTASTELFNAYNANFTGRLVANANGVRIRTDGTLGSPSEAFKADKVTLGNGGVLYTTGNNAIVGSNHGITLNNGGMLWSFGSGSMVVNSPIAGNGGLSIADDTGVVVLAGNNTYTGGTTINSNAAGRGQLMLGAGGTSGTLPAGDVVFNSGAAQARLFINRSDNVTLSNNLIGPGQVFQIGGGTTTLSGNNQTGQSTFVAAGRLKADFSGGNQPIGSGTVVQVGGGAFEYAGPAGDNTLRLGALTSSAAPATAGSTVTVGGGIGDTVIQSTYGGSGAQSLVFNNATRGTAGVTINFVTSGGSNGTTNSIGFTPGASPAVNNVIGAAYYYGSDFAATDGGFFVRAANYGVDANTAALNTVVAGRYSKLTAPLTGQAAVALPGLHLSGSGTNLTMNAGAALTSNGNPGAILKTGGGSGVIGGGAGATLVNSNQELIARPEAASDVLQIDIPITGSGQLTKSGNGQLILTAANTMTGNTLVTNGNIRVAGSGALGVAGGGEIRIATVAGQPAGMTIDSATASISTGSTASSFRIGEVGPGTLTQSAGTVNSGQYMVLGESLGSSGTYNMTGGTLNVKTNNSGTPNLVVGRAGAGNLNVGGSAVVNVLNGAQLQLGTGTFNSAQFQGMTPHASIATGTGSVVQTGGSVNVAVGNGTYQSNIIGGVFIGVDGAGSYTLNGGTLTTPMIGRGNGTAVFNLGGGTLRAATPTATLPASVFHPTLPINVTGTGAGKGSIDTNGNDVYMTSTITGSGGFAKAGTGTLTVLGTGSTYSGGTDINQGTIVSSGTSLGVGNVNVGAGNTLSLQGEQQGLLAKFYHLGGTNVTPGVVNGNTNMLTEFTSQESLNAFLDGKAPVAVESTTARGKTSVNYLEIGGANGNTALPPAIIQTNNGGNPFMAQLSGKFEAPTAGDYAFQTRSDDNSILIIDGKMVLDNNHDQGQTTRTGSVTLTAGAHDIVVAYRQGTGGGGFSVGVTLPGQGQSYTLGSELNMPNSLLHHASNDLTIGSLSGAATSLVQLNGGSLTTGGDNTNTVFDGILTNGTSFTGSFIKTGTGQQTLTGVSSYTGPTTINGGKLIVNGSIATSSMTTVTSGGTLGGNGFVGDLTVDTGGTVAPGNSPGILHTGSITTNSGATYSMEIAGTTAGTTYDQIQATGTVDLEGTLVLSLSYTPTYGNKIFLLLNDGVDAITGMWDGLPEGSTIPIPGGDMVWILSQKDNSASNPTGPSNGLGNDVSLYAVPESGSSALLLLAGTGLLARRRRDRRPS